MMTENIYPLPIQLAQAASTRSALHAALRTLGQLGYRFEYIEATDDFIARSDLYPKLFLDLAFTPTDAFVFTWTGDEYGSEGVPRTHAHDEALGQACALSAVARAIDATRRHQR